MDLRLQTTLITRRGSLISDPQRSALTDQSARRLLSAIAEGDERSMTAFYGLYEKRIHAFACSRLGDSQSAAEIVNEVMLVVWRTAGCFKGRAGVSTWLLGIANNKVLDALRRRYKGNCSHLHWQAPDNSTDTGERRVADGEHRHVINKIVASLPRPQRQVVHLAFFEDLSYTEIAGVLGCPPGTVKTRMYHAKLHLKKRLRRLGIKEGDI